MTAQTTSARLAAILRYAARLISLIWAGWWVLFGLASGIGEGVGILGTLGYMALPGLVFLGATVLAWLWEGIGTFVLIVMGFLICAGYWLVLSSSGVPRSMITSMLLTTGMPPLAAGGLFIVGRWMASRATNTRPNP